MSTATRTRPARPEIAVNRSALGVREMFAAFFVTFGGIAAAMVVAGVMANGQALLWWPLALVMGATAVAFGAGAGREGVTPPRVAGAVGALLALGGLYLWLSAA